MRIKSYFGVSSLATFARVLPQAVLTPILLSKGLHYDSIIWTQIVYMIALTLFEFPSGLLADRFSRKKLYVLSVVVIGGAYGIVWFGEGLAVMCVAWAIYAAGTALSSSTMDIHYALILRDDEPSFRRFFALDRNVILAATIISALTTSVLYPLIGIGVYAVSIVSFAIAAAYGAFALPKTPIVRESQEEAPPRVLDALRRDSWLVLAMLLFALTQLAFTPFFQMWQMVFLDVGLDPRWFGVIFIAFQLINIASNVAWARLRHRQSVSFGLLVALLALGAGILVAGGGWTILLVALIPFPLFLYSNSLVFSLQSRAPEALMSSMNSLMGTASTVGAIFALSVSLVGLQVTAPSMILGGSLITFGVLSMGLLAVAIRQKFTDSPAQGRDPVETAA